MQAEADLSYAGDFTRYMLERLASFYPEAAQFLANNTTAKHSAKK